MCAAQRKFGSPFVIKQGWFPLHAVVAVSTMGDLLLRKLHSVDVSVALFALRWRCLEINVGQPGLKIGGLVAIHA